MTSVILEMDPGTLRELYWHPNADEWQNLLAGTIRATLFGSRGRCREALLDVGDVDYIPQGSSLGFCSFGALFPVAETAL